MIIHLKEDKNYASTKKNSISSTGDLDVYKALIDGLKSCSYDLIQYIPSRQSMLLGQEISVLLSFVFRKKPCLFNSTVFLPLYLNLFRFFHSLSYKLFKIFFAGAKFKKENLTNNIFSERDFEIFVEKGFFQKVASEYQSCYRFIPVGEVILIGKFDENREDYVHTGYDTMISYYNIKDELRGTGEIERALEIGCGTGFLSLFVAKKAGTVDAVDINPEAIRLTKINTKLDGVNNINTFESDVYYKVEGKYDYIFSNPPFELLPEEKAGMLHSFGGDLGLEITTRILEGLDKHLSEHGRAHILSNTYIKDSRENILKQIVERIFSKKNFDITLKELSYQLNPEYYRHYKRKGITHSISYFITIQRSDSYRLKVVPLSFVSKIRERMRLSILRSLSFLKVRKVDLRKVVFVDTAKKAKKLIDGSTNVKFIILNEVLEANLIRDILKIENRCQELNKRNICESNFSNLRHEYIKFIGQLNIANSSSNSFWWSYFFTNKNPIASRLFYDISNILILKEALNEEFDCLIVVTDRCILLRQMILDGSLKSFIIRDMICRRRGIIDILKNFTLVLLISKFFRTILFKSLVLLFGRHPHIRGETHKTYMAVRTLVTERSFREGRYKDIYFGELLDYLAIKDIPIIIVAAITGDYLKILRKIKKRKKPTLVIPMEYWISWRQILKTLFVSLKNCFMTYRVRGNTKIYGTDVGRLIQDSIKDDITSTAFFSHVESYYSFESFIKKVKIRKLVYPMENRPWERMMIKAIRSSSLNCRIVGYQHASIGPKHMNFVLSDGEINVIPFPDEIITMGEVTKDILVRECGVPMEIITAGCALRQSNRIVAIKNKPKIISNILVALASNIEEYTETLLSIEEAFRGLSNFNIRIRPHPTVPIGPLIKDVRNFGIKFELTDKMDVREDLNWSDVLIYVSSTISLEALSLGVPVIYLDIDPFLNRDPLFDMAILKWSVRKPSEMMELLKTIEEMAEDDYAKRQLGALEYIHKYLNPATEEYLNRFI